MLNFGSTLQITNILKNQILILFFLNYYANIFSREKRQPTYNSVNKKCPIFHGSIERIHWSIEDPFEGWDFDLNQLKSFRKTRKKIESKIIKFLKNY